MPATCAKSFFRAVVHRIGNAATAYHLWCAEQELRLVDTRDLEPSLREARERNLAVLREYRRRGQFPHHAHGKTLGLPCFIDAVGQQCAVACLMHASGDDAAALKVAEAANIARIGEMHFTQLDAWASESGFTKDELARIQPAYAPEPEQLDSYLKIMTLLCVVGAFAGVSILANAARLFRGYGAHLGRSCLGIVAGIALIVIAGFAEVDGSYNRPWIRNNLTRHQLIAIGVGLASVAFAIIPFFLRGNKHEPIDAPEPIPAAESPAKSTGIKEMDGWN